jgi:GAF domain
MADLLTNIMQAIILIGLIVLGVWTKRWIDALNGTVAALKGAVDAQRETIAAQKEIREGLQALIDEADTPTMLERLESYKKFVDHEKEALKQTFTQQLDEAKQKSSRNLAAMEVVVSRMAGMMNIIAALMPYMPREERKKAIETTNFDDQFKEIMLRLADQAPDLLKAATIEMLRVVASSPTDIQAVLDVILKNAARLCDAPCAAIHTVDGNVIRRLAALEQVPTSPIGEEIRLSRDRLPARAIVDRETIHVIDSNVPPDIELPAGILKGDGLWGAKTMLATPLLREGKTAIGCIVVRRFDYRPFTPKEIALLKTFADQAVIAIEPARFREGRG